MRAGVIDPATASLFLMLLDYAEAQAPGAGIAFLRGYCSRATGEPLVSPDPTAGTGVTIGRVNLRRG